MTEVQSGRRCWTTNNRRIQNDLLDVRGSPRGGHAKTTRFYEGRHQGGRFYHGRHRLGDNVLKFVQRPLELIWLKPDLRRWRPVNLWRRPLPLYRRSCQSETTFLMTKNPCRSNARGFLCLKPLSHDPCNEIMNSFPEEVSKEGVLPR